MLYLALMLGFSIFPIKLFFTPNKFANRACEHSEHLNCGLLEQSEMAGNSPQAAHRTKPCTAQALRLISHFRKWAPPWNKALSAIECTGMGTFLLKLDNGSPDL